MVRADQRQLRLDLTHAHQRAPVEALDGDLLEQPGGADLGRGDPDELLAGGGLGRGARLDLGLDVELHVLRPVAVDQREHLTQQRHPGTRDGELAGLVRSVFEPQSSERDLGQAERVDVLPDVRELRVAGRHRGGVDALGAGDLPVVGDDGLAVLGDLHVQFEGGHPELEGVAEGGEGVLHPQPEAAPVGLHVECPVRSRFRLGGHREPGRHRRGNQGRDGGTAYCAHAVIPSCRRASPTGRRTAWTSRAAGRRPAGGATVNRRGRPPGHAGFGRPVAGHAVSSTASAR